MMRTLIAALCVGLGAAATATNLAALHEEIVKQKDVCRATKENCGKDHSACEGPGLHACGTVKTCQAFLDHVRKQLLLTPDNCAKTHGACKCTGNRGKARQQKYYPELMGNNCQAWDDKMDYCKEGGANFGAAWCDDPWCYTSEGCPTSSPGSYFTAENGPQLYYNYDVCGSVDEYTAPAAGGA